MIDFESFISEEIAIAPPHPLAQNLDLPLPDTSSASVQEIREIQLRDRIPGVVKRIVLVDADTFWQYWWCVPGRMLLPEDVELLKCDRPRLESILEKLVWLFGGFCFGANSDREGKQVPIHDWQDVVKFAQQQGYESYVLDIDFMPIAIKYAPQSSHPTQTTHIAVEPPHWHIEFLQLTPIPGGYKVQEPKTACSCQIWTGMPFLKQVPTGITSSRYDLWVSRPLDITQPPWLK